MPTYLMSKAFFGLLGGACAQRLPAFAAGVFAFLVAATTSAATLTALSTFGSGGYIAPGGSNPYVTTGDTQRGLAFNSSTKNLVLVARQNVSGTSNNVVILNGTTGAVEKTMNNSGVSGGTLLVNLTDVASDGTIYVANLSGTSATPGQFKVYSWASEASTSAPSNPFVATVANSVIRIGDSFSTYGTGAAAQFVAAGSSTGSNSNFTQGLLNSSNTFTRYTSIANTSGGVSNDYRLSLAYIDADTIIGNQGTSAKITDFSGVLATVTGSIGLGAAQRPLDYAVFGTTPMMAVADSNSGLVSVYDITTPASPLLMASLDLQSTANTNTNGAGSVAWGDVTDLGGGNYEAKLYTLITNNGIQAMVFAVPEPSTTAMALTCSVGLAAMMLRRRRQP